MQSDTLYMLLAAVMTGGSLYIIGYIAVTSIISLFRGFNR